MDFLRIKSKDILDNIKSKYFVQNFLNILPKKKLLQILQYNKALQSLMNLTVNDYKTYSKQFSSIEIKIIWQKINLVYLLI